MILIPRFAKGRIVWIAATLLIVLTNNIWAGDEARLLLGKKVFTELAEPRCAICHTLEDAGAEGEVGPVLDKLRPSEEKVRKAVTGGVGAMPPYENLTREQIDAVAAYVASVTGGGRSKPSVD